MTEIKRETQPGGEAESNVFVALGRPLKHLTSRDIESIDEALSSIGAFGEVRLIKERDKLRFIQTVRSRDIRKEE